MNEWISVKDQVPEFVFSVETVGEEGSCLEQTQ